MTNPSKAAVPPGGKSGNGQSGSGRPGLPRDAAGSVFSGEVPGGAARTVSAVLGEIVWLLTQSPQHSRAIFIGDLEWMAMPPILLQQLRLFYAKDKPIGAILWAIVNEEVEERLLVGNAACVRRTGSAATGSGSSRCWPPSAAPTRC
jgi:hypothetical protein